MKIAEIRALLERHVADYQAKMEEYRQSILESYAAGNTNVDWVRQRMLFLEGRIDAVQRVLQELPPKE